MKLAKREKIFVYTAAAFICIFLVIELLIVPFFNRKAELRKGIITKEREIEELAEISSKYQNIDRLSGNIAKVLSGRKTGFTLFSFLETAATQTDVKDKIKYMKPSESKSSDDYMEQMIEMKLEAITLEQLSAYLYQIEKPEQLVFIKRISITGNKKEEGSLDSILQVITFK